MKPALLTPITTRDALIELAQRLCQHSDVAFDTEFHADNSYRPKLMLVQLASKDEVAIVDPLAPEVRASLGGFFEVLRMKGVRLVGHALEHDLELYHRVTGTMPASIFDTQLAAAFLGYGDRIGLADLLKRRRGLALEKLYSRADWGKRPLPEAQLEYAADDVRHSLALAEDLSADLDAKGRRAWFEEEQVSLLEPDRYEPARPEEAWRRVGRRKGLDSAASTALEELAAARERVAAKRDEPTRRVLPDDALVDLARRAPSPDEALRGETMRRAPAGLDRFEREWRAALARAKGRPPLPPAPAAAPEDPAQRRVTRLAELTTELVLGAYDVAPRLVWPEIEPHLGRVIETPAEDVDDLTQALGLRGWRAELLGPVLYGVLSGRGGPRVFDGDGGLDARVEFD